MKPKPENQTLEKLKAAVVPILQDPVKLKLVVIYGICFVGFVLIGLPMFLHLRTLEDNLERELERKKLILTIQNIKAKQNVYNAHLNKNGNLNWWVEYLLEASRNCNLRIKEYKPFEPLAPGTRSGTYKGYLFRVGVMGQYNNYVSFVNWVESNKWGMRIPRMSMEMQRKGTFIDGNMTIAIFAATVAPPGSVAASP
jgi:hypothetical protein